MTDHESPAHLEWWANPSTCLARIPVRVTAALDGGVWNAAVPPDFVGRQAGDGLQFLIDADPIFTLRFEDGSVTEVVVDHSEDLEHLHLESLQGSGRR
jgi:hypothetical protein